MPFSPFFFLLNLNLISYRNLLVSVVLVYVIFERKKVKRRPLIFLIYIA